MLLRKWLGTSGLAATLQSNKSPTSNSSIKVSPKTFKVIHSFSKKEALERFCNSTELLVLHYMPWYHSFPHPSFSHCTFICENVLRTRFCVCVHVNNNWCKKYPVRAGVLLKYKSTYCYFLWRIWGHHKNLYGLKGIFVIQKSTSFCEHWWS